jgi:hypothetical protein
MPIGAGRNSGIERRNGLKLIGPRKVAALYIL